MLPIEKPNLTLVKWRGKITNMLGVLAIIVTMAELFVFLLLTCSGRGYGMDRDLYLLEFLILPSLINYVAVVLNFRVQHMPRAGESMKNYAIIITSTAICTVIGIAHYAVMTTLACFPIPVLMSTLFADRKKLHITAFLNIMMLTVCAAHSYFLLKNADFFLIDVFAAYVIMTAAILLSHILITYIAEKREYIFSSYKNQLELDEKIKLDPLTNLYNQSAFFSKLRRCTEAAAKKGKRFPVAILDIDDFKSVNDTFGHSMGNKVLEGLSGTMGLVFSLDNEFVARYGGEEFGIIFENLEVGEACARIEQLRHRFAEEQCSRIDDKEITFSGGVTEFIPGDEAGTIFNRADAALYEAKNRGKNQTVQK